jgi:hypothetical protein
MYGDIMELMKQQQQQQQEQPSTNLAGLKQLDLLNSNEHHQSKLKY